jgi:hypothetical protein
MASEKATYWIAVAVLAVVVGNHIASRIEGRCVSDRAQAVVQRLSSQASQLIAMADVMLGRTEAGLGQSDLAMARVQGAIARQQAACARIQAERSMMVLQQVERMRVPVVCPRQRVQVVIPQLPVPNDGTI